MRRPAVGTSIISTTLLEERALRLLLDGNNYTQVGLQMGVTRDTARRYALAGLRHAQEKRDDAAHLYRGILADRYERLYLAAEQRALKGSLQAMDRADRFLEKLALVHGVELDETRGREIELQRLTLETARAAIDAAQQHAQPLREGYESRTLHDPGEVEDDRDTAATSRVPGGRIALPPPE